jgi:hypothetical protein
VRPTRPWTWFGRAAADRRQLLSRRAALKSSKLVVTGAASVYDERVYLDYSNQTRVERDFGRESVPLGDVEVEFEPCKGQ